MFFDFDSYNYYVSPGTTDMRRGSDSLAQFVTEHMRMDPFSKNMFLFCSKNKKVLCVLVWDNGFWIMKKKLYSGTFAWPKDEAQALKITVDDVKRVIRGDDVFRRIPELGNELKF